MSGSQSEQSDQTTFTDNRNVIGEGAVYANNGASVYQTSNTFNNTTDFGAIDGAINFATDFGSNALRTIDSGNAKAFDFAGDAFGGGLQFADGALAKVIDFSTDAQAGAFDFARSANAGALNATADALAAGRSAFSSALSFAGGTTAAALDNMQATQQLTAAAYNDAKGRGALTDKIIIGAIGAVLLIAFVALQGRK